MAPDKESTVTFVIPDDLKREIRSAADAEGDTITGFVRNALRERLAPRVRAVVPPAFTEHFNAVVARARASHEKNRQHEILLMVEDRRGRTLVRGWLKLEDSNESVIAVRPQSMDKPVYVPRLHVVGWFDATWSQHGNDLEGRQWTLLEQGWAPGAGVHHEGATIRALLVGLLGEPSTPTKLAKSLGLPQPRVVEMLEWLYVNAGLVRTVETVQEGNRREATWGVAVPGGRAVLLETARTRGVAIDALIEA